MGAVKALTALGGAFASLLLASRGTSAAPRGRVSGQTTGLGPGAGPWVTASPEAHGMSSHALEEAAAATQRMAPERHCFAVIKDGKLVHETYFGEAKQTDRYESDSLAKTATALVVAAASSQGLFDLDVPLAKYNVTPTPPGVWDLGPDGGHWENVTARHLLGQTGGCVTGTGCTAPPGTAWTYDSENYIEHLSYLVGKTSGAPAVEWATQHFAAPIGLPHLYVNDHDGTDFSAGGGQLMSCRDHLRVAQVLLNDGAWPMDDGTVKQLVSPELAKAVLQPSHPAVSKAYGFLTWLGGAHKDPDDVACCAPRWGNNQTCKGRQLLGSILGDDFSAMRLPDQAAGGVGIGMGWLGQYIFVMPEHKLAVVSLGSSWGSSLECPAQRGDGYDDAFSATQVWRAFSNITTTIASTQHAAPLTTPIAIAKGGTAPKPAPARAAPAVGSPQGTAGSCTCACPPGRGNGFCFAMPAGTTQGDCSSIHNRAHGICPSLGVPSQCHDPPVAEDEDCAAISKNIRGDVGNRKVWGGHVNCTLSSRCTRSYSAGDQPGHPSWISATCACKAVSFGPEACAWKDGPCAYSDYYPPPPDV